MRGYDLALCAAFLLSIDLSSAAAQSALELETKIPLGAVIGRIDHLAIDLDHRRLFVAELGNDSVGVVDLDRREVAQRIGRLSEPQGVAYLPQLGTLVAANAHDGSLRFFSGPKLELAGRLDLKDDADNIRVLPDGRTIAVGYGSGAIAIIDVVDRQKRSEIRLDGHPEGFQIDPAGVRIFVNVPDARQVAVLDRQLGHQIARWGVPGARSNFPMAYLAPRKEVVAIFRSPARLVSFRADDGAVIANHETCDDADDVFHDARRDRVYVTCGEGVIDIFQLGADGYRRLPHVQTVSGARTALFVPELDRLFVAVRARWREPAAIWIFKPV